jgi:hypothetical protein
MASLHHPVQKGRLVNRERVGAKYAPIHGAHVSGVLRLAAFDDVFRHAAIPRIPAIHEFAYP